MDLATGALLVAVLIAHVATAIVLSRALGLRGADAAWGAVLAVFLQLGSIATALSLIRSLTATGWTIAAALLTAGALGGAWRRQRTRIGAEPLPIKANRRALRPEGLLLSALLVLLIGGVVTVAWGTPLYRGDDLATNASRALHWRQNRSVAPFETHNDRHNTYPVAPSLPFLLGVVFTADERVGRLLHLAALPLSAWGLLNLQRGLGVPARFAGPGLLLFLTTPLVLRTADGVGPDLWAAVGLLGFCHWLVRLRRHPSDARVWLLFGAFGALCAGFRLTLLPLVLLLPLVWLAQAPRIRRPAPCARALVAGLATTTLASGLVVTLAGSALSYGHPLGPESMRRVHTSEVGPRQLLVHSARVPFLLAGLPPVGDDRLRVRLETAARGLARRLGALELLPGEGEGWPGRFQVSLPAVDERFSLTGLFVAAAALWVALRAGRRAARRLRLVWPPFAVLILCVGLFAAIVYGMRWQPTAAVPDRMLVPLLGPGCALVSLAFAAAWRQRLLRPVLATALLWGAVPGSLILGERVNQVLAGGPPRGRGGAFAEAAAALPAGARVLLVGSQYCPDYLLFGPDAGYPNVVIPWGKAAFDRARLLATIEQAGVTHVLVENHEAVDLHWAGELATGPFVRTLARLPGSRRVALGDPEMRLFALTGKR